MQVDYIIVGFGLAGLALVEELKARGKSFVVFEDDSQTSSKVAGGMYNPVILKRFTPVWDSEEQLKIALPFYENLENQLQAQYDYKIPIFRVFKSVEEQNNWFVAADKPRLSPYMKSELHFESYHGIPSEFGYGALKGTGRIDVNRLLEDYKKVLDTEGVLYKESFDYEKLNANDVFTYDNIRAEKIICCEGYGLKKNPYFKELPLMGAKGELLVIKAPDLDINFLLKAAVFVMPLGNNLFKVGATFNWTDKTIQPTKEGREELLEKLNTVIDVPFEVVQQNAGIRPTVKDRRPLLGEHSEVKNLYVFNGLGTRGVMIAPKYAKKLLQFIENGAPLPQEVAITRFYNQAQ